MIFSWKLQWDYDLLAVSTHSMGTATKLWLKCTPAIFLRCLCSAHLKFLWKLDNITLVSNNSSVWALGRYNYFFGNFEMSLFI